MNDYVDAVRALAQFCWHNRTSSHWIKTPNGPMCVHRPLMEPEVARHVDGGPAVGLAPIPPGTSSTRIAVLDFDSHKGEVPWEKMIEHARRVHSELFNRGIEAIPFRSSGGQGIHLMMLWEEPQDAYSVRELLKNALAQCKLQPGTKGVSFGQVEIFPKQDSVPADGFGNMFILPFAGESLLLDLVTGECLSESDLPASWPLSKPVLVRERPVREPPAVSVFEVGDYAKLREKLQRLSNNDREYRREKGSGSPPGWWDIIAAIHRETGGSDVGLQLAHEWSRKSSKHNPDFLDQRVWPYLRDDREDGITGELIDAELEREGHTEHVRDELGVDSSTVEPAPVTREDAGSTPAQPANVKYPARSPSEHIAATGRMRWHIEGVLPATDIAVLVGSPKVGKSFLTLDMAICIARGAPWRDQECIQSPVAMVVAEGRHGFAQRLRAAGVTDGDPIDIYPHAPSLHLKTDAMALHESLAHHAKQRGARYGLIVVDTLAASMAGANENSGEDMGAVLKHCQLIADAQHATVLLVHHLGKDLTKGARGWSGIEGAADVLLTVTRAQHLRYVEITRMKDGVEGAIYEFTLPIVALDGGGTSCVVQHEHVGRTTAAVQPPSTTRRWARRVWEAAVELIEASEFTTLDAILEQVKRKTEAISDVPDNWRSKSIDEFEKLVEAGKLRVENREVRIGR